MSFPVFSQLPVKMVATALQKCVFVCSPEKEDGKEREKYLMLLSSTTAGSFPEPPSKLFHRSCICSHFQKTWEHSFPFNPLWVASAFFSLVWIKVPVLRDSRIFWWGLCWCHSSPPPHWMKDFEGIKGVTSTILQFLLIAYDALSLNQMWCSLFLLLFFYFFLPFEDYFYL